MGLFDYITCLYPLPIKGKFNFQTKSTPAQFMDKYEIREDGTLWHENYDIEDHSDPNAQGFKKFIGCMTKVNRKWEQENFTGEIQFDDVVDNKWIVFSSYFVKGQLKELHLLESDKE